MKLLIIDTTKPTAFIVAKVDEESFVKIIPDTQKHSEELLNGIDYILSSAGVTISNFDAVAAITGPGSFTGIRIGMSTVKAFACAYKNLKVLSATNFDILKSYVKNGTIVLKNTSTACYMAKVKNSKIIETNIVNYEDVSAQSEGKVFAIEQEHLNNVLSYINLNTITNYEKLLEDYFVNEFNKKNFVALNNFSPYYMQLSQAERELKDKNND